MIRRWSPDILGDVAPMPMVRARGPQSTLAHISKVSPQAHALIRERAPAHALEFVDRSPKTAWIPVEYDMAIFVPAWTEWFTPEETKSFCDGAVEDMLISPLLRPLVEFALRITGSTPKSLLKVFPRGWGQVYRDCCRVSVENIDPNYSRLYFTEMHPTYAGGFTVYQYAIRSIIEGLFKLTNASGSVEFEDALTARRSTAHLRWNNAP